MFLQHLIPDSPSVIVISSKRVSCAPKSGRSPPKVLFLISSIFSFFSLILCFVFPSIAHFFVERFLNSSHVFREKNKFPLSVGFCLFSIVSQLFPFWGNGMNSLYPLGNFVFSRFFSNFIPSFWGRILSRLQNYKKYAKVISSKLRKK